jgi:hypothetical protein
MRNGLLIAGLVSVGVLGVVPALAQSQGGSTLQAPNPDTQKTPTPSLPNTGETLSKKLERSDGVIQPPAGIDPGATVAPRDPGAGSAMPVIPPPGSPGGDQSIKPK